MTLFAKTGLALGKMMAAFSLCAASVVVAPVTAAEQGAAETASGTQSCDRACLKHTVAQYLEAMARGDAGTLKLADGVRATSNSVAVEVGAGATWEGKITINNRHSFVDPHTGTAIFFGTIAGAPADTAAPTSGSSDTRKWWHYALRLTVNQAGKITEIEEQSTLRGMQTADKVGVPFQESVLFREVLPENERRSADELVDIADGYWDALTSGKASDAAFGPDCQRTEFGKFSTNNPMTPHGRGRADWVPEPQIGPSCISFFDRPRFRWSVTNRRYYIADEARGVVVGIGQLERFGEDGNDPLTLFEAFKIVDGQIEWLWAPAFSWNLEQSGWTDWQRPAAND